MASLHKRTASPYWWGKFRDETRTVRFRSTKKEKRSDALEIVMAWERSAIAAGSGELTRAAVLKTLNEMLERTTGERVEVFTVQQFLDGWMAGKTRTGKSEGTTSRYKPIVRDFLFFLGEKRAAVSIGGVTATDVEGFRNKEIECGKSPSTADLALKIIRGAFNDAKRKGLILSNPADAVELILAPANEREPFKDEEVRQLLTVADVEWKGMILLGAHAGLRIGDASKLLRSDLDMTSRTFEFCAQKTSRRMHGKPQTIAMHPELFSYFKKLPPCEDSKSPIFPTLYLRGAGGHQGLSNAFNALMIKAQIRQTATVKREGKGRGFNALTFHSFRHTFISRLANADVGSDVRKEIVGHSSDESHRRYTHLDVSVQRRALLRLNSFS